MAMPKQGPGPAASFLSRLFAVEADEAPAVAAGVLMFFLLFAGYFMLRPVRETMGIAGGVQNLQWLFTGTFIATLAAIPLFGWVAARAPRRRILPWTYGFFALNLLGFAAAIAAQPDNPWIARAFYIWLSVFNLLAISVAWSVLADLFPVAQAKRLFALMAAGASAGGLVGPLLGVLLVGALGLPGLMALSTALLLGSALAARSLQAWRDHRPLRADDQAARRQPLGGNPFAGIGEVLQSRYLLGIAAFVVLLASVTTFLYFEQARLVELHFPDRTDQTRVFGTLDFIVQSLAPAQPAVPDRTHRAAARHRRAADGGTRGHDPGLPVARVGADFRGVCGSDGHAPCRRIRTGATGPRDAVHRGPARGQVQGQERDRHRCLSWRGRSQRLGEDGR